MDKDINKPSDETDGYLNPKKQEQYTGIEVYDQSKASKSQHGILTRIIYRSKIYISELRGKFQSESESELNLRPNGTAIKAASDLAGRNAIHLIDLNLELHIIDWEYARHCRYMLDRWGFIRRKKDVALCVWHTKEALMPVLTWLRKNYILYGRYQFNRKWEKVVPVKVRELLDEVVMAHMAVDERQTAKRGPIRALNEIFLAAFQMEVSFLPNQVVRYMAALFDHDYRNLKSEMMNPHFKWKKGMASPIDELPLNDEMLDDLLGLRIRSKSISSNASSLSGTLDRRSSSSSTVACLVPQKSVRKVSFSVAENKRKSSETEMVTICDTNLNSSPKKHLKVLCDKVARRRSSVGLSPQQQKLLAAMMDPKDKEEVDQKMSRLAEKSKACLTEEELSRSLGDIYLTERNYAYRLPGHTCRGHCSSKPDSSSSDIRYQVKDIKRRLSCNLSIDCQKTPVN